MTQGKETYISESIRDILFFIIGIVFLFLAKVKNIVKGYSSPKPFDASEIFQCIDYDISVVENWLRYLQLYTKSEYSLTGKNVLELGPGSDLGIGIYLLSKGCSQYNACDVNNLINSTPDEFYDKLFNKLHEINIQTEILYLKEELLKYKNGNISRINYNVNIDFDLVSAFGKNSIDIIFSQAAFEHFDDINKTISQLNIVCKSGAILIVAVDLMTHSRWIREKDPNNIYRYPDWLYKLFWFRGSPNRLRPIQYKKALERFGWIDITITPFAVLDSARYSHTGWDKAFLDPTCQMSYVSVMICARKS